MELTKSELEVMNVLWQAKQAAVHSEILTLSTSKTWKDSSIHILLNDALLNKTPSKKQAMSEVERPLDVCMRRIFPVRNTMQRMCLPAAKVLPMLFSALIQSDGISPELINELEDMLEKRKELL